MGIRESTCQECGTIYVPKKGGQMFCSRKCFKRNYGKRQKEYWLLHRYPSFACEFCHGSNELEFDPIKQPLLWNLAVCKHCGKPRNEKFFSSVALEIRVSDSLVVTNTTFAYNPIMITESIEDIVLGSNLGHLFP